MDRPEKTEQHRERPSDGSGDGQQDEKSKQSSHDEEVENRRSPSGSIVYKAICKEGLDELKRPSSALWWSGVAAGLSMGFSLVAEGLLKAHLPEATWATLISKLGYSMGFLIVVLGRQQLFTENTLTVILPWLTDRSWDKFWNITRLWIVVFIANIIGTAVFAAVVSHSSTFDAETRAAFAALGHHAMLHGFGTVLLRGIFGGWLIALMVWLLPFAESFRVLVIILLTYLVGLGDFSHVIAGAVETLYTVMIGEKSFAIWLIGFLLPALLGNIIGGVTLVAVLNHAQVMAGGGGEDI